MEEWKQTKYNNYEVSNLGRVRNKHTGKVLKPATPYNYDRACSTYQMVNIQGRTVAVHRLVAETFLPNPLEKPTVHHIDGDKNNNCVENLEWATHRENIVKSRHAGLFKGEGKMRFLYTIEGVFDSDYESIEALLAKHKKSDIMFSADLSLRSPDRKYICLKERDDCKAFVWAAIYKQLKDIYCFYKSGTIITIDGTPYKWYDTTYFAPLNYADKQKYRKKHM